jgi:hypothetical protein
MMLSSTFLLVLHVARGYLVPLDVPPEFSFHRGKIATIRGDSIEIYPYSSRSPYSYNTTMTGALGIETLRELTLFWYLIFA